MEKNLPDLPDATRTEQRTIQTMLRSWATHDGRFALNDTSLLESHEGKLAEEVASLEVKLAQEAARLHHKRSQLEAMHQAIAERKSLGAPVRSLPREVLLNIFALARSSSLNPSVMPHLLGHVCKFWRTLSRASPSLWNHITLAPSDWKGAEAKSMIKVLKEHLFLSQSLPLHLDLYFPSAESHIDMHVPVAQYAHSMVSILSTYATDWQSLRIEGHPTFYVTFFDALSRVQMPKLEILTMHCWDLGSFVYPQNAALSFGPSLREVGCNMGPPPLNVVKWNLLTSYSGSFSSDAQGHQFLSAAVNLGTLTLHHVGLNANPVPLTPITCSRMRHLSLNPCAISDLLGRLTMPKLETLTLHEWQSFDHLTDCIESDDEAKHLRAFLSRSECPLAAIIVHGELSSHLPTILDHPKQAATASLKKLHIQIEDRLASREAGNNIFEMLTLSSTGKGFLPNVIEFQLDVTNAEPDHTDVFLMPSLERMIMSRSKHLQKLRLSSDAEYMTEEWEDTYSSSKLSVLLQQLSEDRMDVQWGIDTYDVLENGKSWAQRIR